jgi:hypothetical protein
MHRFMSQCCSQQCSAVVNTSIMLERAMDMRFTSRVASLTVVESEKQHVGRVEIEFCHQLWTVKDRMTHCRPIGPRSPDHYGYRQSRSILSAHPTRRSTYQTKHGIRFSISLHQAHTSARHKPRIDEGLTRRIPYVSFRSIVVPLPDQ